MTDFRLSPDPSRITMNKAASVIVPVTDLCRHIDGPRDRQLLYGDLVDVLNRDGSWSYVQSSKDGYCGYIRSQCLGHLDPPTHAVSAPATHAYTSPDLKSPERISLSFGCQIAVTDISGAFAQTSAGYIPVGHIAPIGKHSDDPVTVAELFLGTPYLWGGNSRWGIDCSGLIQAAFLACGISCPGDSDQQESLGEPATVPYQRNDLIFWKGHVAIVTDPATLLHANGGSMSTRYEGISDAISRIEAAGDGPVTAHRRVKHS